MNDERFSDPSHRAWMSNADLVAQAPDCATIEQLEQAIKFLRYRRAVVILTARRRHRNPSQRALRVLDARITEYAGLLHAISDFDEP